MKDYDNITWEDENCWIKNLAQGIGAEVFVNTWIFPDDRDREPNDFERRLFHALDKDRELAEELYKMVYDDEFPWSWAAAKVKEKLPQVVAETAVE